MSEEMVNEVAEEAHDDQQQASGSAPENNAEAPKADGGDEKVSVKALIAERKRRQEYEARIAEYEAKEKKAADDEAAKRGEIDRFRAERDELAEKVKRYEASATTELESLTERLDDAGKAVLADLEGDPLDKQLSVARKLAAVKKTEEPQGFGSGGGKAAGGNTGLIPPTVGTMSEFHQWMANLQNDAEGRALLMDRDKMSRVRAEAAKRFR